MAVVEEVEEAEAVVEEGPAFAESSSECADARHARVRWAWPMQEHSAKHESAVSADATPAAIW